MVVVLKHQKQPSVFNLPFICDWWYIKNNKIFNSMSLSIGIVGLPNVGKSTLFQAITKKQVECANYPFCTIDPNVGVVKVPDERVDELARLSNSAKKIYTTVEFVDIAGLVKGASQGEGLGNKFLTNIKETDAIAYVLRCFPNKKIINTQSKVNILEDKEILDTEMALKDLAVIEKRIEGLQKKIKANNKEAAEEMNVLKKAYDFLEKGSVLIGQDWNKEEIKILKNYQFLTMKPRLYLLNGDEKDILEETKELFKKNNWSFLIINTLTELEAADFSSEERVSLGLPKEPQINALIKESYKLLNLITFLTTGKDETRAWTLKEGKTIQQAAGVIHSDFEERFIKADVVGWQELIEAGGYEGAREKGLIRVEGREYITADGDVVVIKSDA